MNGGDDTFVNGEKNLLKIIKISFLFGPIYASD
jgi:hypothetical protein